MLNETSVLLVQDWAMKYQPRSQGLFPGLGVDEILARKYLESQTDWFGKRRIPWHISVSFRKRDEQIELLHSATSSNPEHKVVARCLR